ncbi:MAG TPA: glutamine synthetase III, partial [Planctomycetota bacterium]|nr:glutamine synthetase III [Planctomycetota bacterium]
NVFNEEAQRARLPKPIFKALQKTIKQGAQLTDPAIAEAVASAMKDWAIEHGATHYTHLFQPMTGLTAEKHDSFINVGPEGLLMEFSGKMLIKGEPDASSFPSGGLRSTFEARGYTAWDPTSPAFLRETDNGATLCIPTAFCSWSGEALDKKTPLLRSADALAKQALRLVHALGDTGVRWVFPTLGCEQEYFLIDRHFQSLRPDLVASGRTLLGARPPKGQELEDHYFGAISPRVLAFMQDVERELWKLGVPAKTRHNEVAPGQYELAPIFERTTVAVDHNMLTMEVLKDTALKHGFVCLLHEKPFGGVNGSGKHNNWSVATDRGDNLLDPGRNPARNLRFMTVLACIVRAVDLHADLLRTTIAHAGNDHRLGANEAPPAIISIYLGDHLDKIVQAWSDGAGSSEQKGGTTSMSLGTAALPSVPRDATDRNRTSPFAFTGNKFEFRAVGSSQSPATPNIVLNTIAAESFGWFADELAKRKKGGGAADVEAAAASLIQETLRKHRRIIFNGNGYSQEWQQEAERRGLPNLRNAVDAMARYATEKNVALFEAHGVHTRSEVEARSHIMYEGYCKTIAVEAHSLLGIASTAVLPAAMRHQERVAASVSAASAAGVDAAPQQEMLRTLAHRIHALIASIEELREASDKGDHHHGAPRDHALFMRDHVAASVARVREACDALEIVVADDLWPLPKYREMLFIH